MRSVVVLPEPDGPSSVKNSPSGDLEVDAVDGANVAVVLGERAQANVGKRRIGVGDRRWCCGYLDETTPLVNTTPPSLDAAASA